jgi:predicted ATPase
MDEKKQKLTDIKLRRLEIKNFKAIDELTIEFPPPLMSGDPDVFIMGSKNGLGKTSVLEAIGLLYLAVTVGEHELDIGHFAEMPVNLPELLIRSGTEVASIEGIFTINDKECRIGLSLATNGIVMIHGKRGPFVGVRKPFSPRYPLETMQFIKRFLFSLVGFNAEPTIDPPFLYFHSYRKVQEGNPALGMMVEGDRMSLGNLMRSPSPISVFKLQMLRSMLGDANLFDVVEDDHAGEVLAKLNQLVERFAGGTIGKLRPSQDNTVDFRIYPSNNNENKNSYSFDGLSSGQKEIISTLFLIWHHSQNKPSIVLIDEPELHLNAEWHRDFIRQVFDLAPQNQYIIATHSEDIFSSVSDDRRALLEASDKVHA